MHRIFCYGTLQVPQVVKAVTGRLYNGSKARLYGYAAYKVKSAEYPGLVLSSDQTIEGLLYPGVTDKELKVLDAFEGPFYERRLVEVHLLDGSETKAWVYVIREEHKNILSEEPWYLEEFLDKGFLSFMNRYVHGRKEEYAPGE